MKISFKAALIFFMLNLTVLDSAVALPNFCARLFGAGKPREDVTEFEMAKAEIGQRREMTRTELNNNPAIEQILKNSIEIIYKDSPPFGHIQLRIGKRLYAFNYIMSTVRTDFNPAAVTNVTGGLKMVDASDIKKYQDQIEAMYEASARDNIPPFDAYSPLVELLKIEGENRYSFKSPSPEYKASEVVRGEIITEGNKKLLKSTTGHTVDIIERNGKMYVQSYSCSTSACQVLRTFFDVNIPFGGARDLLYFIQNSQSLIKIQSP